MTQAATIPRTGLEGMGTNRPWNWRLTVLKTSKMMLVRPPGPISRWRWELPVLFLHGAPCLSLYTPWNSPLKALAHCQWKMMSAFGHESTHPPPNPRLPTSEIKQTFLSSNLASLLASEQLAADTAFGNETTVSGKLVTVSIRMTHHWPHPRSPFVRELPEAESRQWPSYSPSSLKHLSQSLHTFQWTPARFLPEDLTHTDAWQGCSFPGSIFLFPAH